MMDERFKREHQAAWDAWARRTDEGNPMRGILIACMGGLLLWAGPIVSWALGHPWYWWGYVLYAAVGIVLFVRQLRRG